MILHRAEAPDQRAGTRDLQRLLIDHPPATSQQKRARSARVTRLVRLLRAHGLIKKVPSTHRYLLTDKGRAIIGAVIQSYNVTPEQLQKAVA